MTRATGDPTSGKLVVGWVQQHATDDPHENLERLEEGIRATASLGARLIVLPELHNGRYFCVTEDLAAFDRAESIPGPTTRALGEVARELGVVVVASLFERRARGLYHNTAAVLDADGSLAGMYRKMHIPDDPGYSEKYYFAPGDLGFAPIDTQWGRIGVLVCWDQWYPEAARLMALAGADVLVYPTAIGFNPDDDADQQERQRDAWVTVQRAHAIANGIPVVAVNRIGFEPDPSGRTAGSRFWGTSFACDSMGKLLHVSPVDRPEAAVVAVDFEQAELDRRVWPFFRDRRIDAYQDIVRRWRDGGAR